MSMPPALPALYSTSTEQPAPRDTATVTHDMEMGTNPQHLPSDTEDTDINTHQAFLSRCLMLACDIKTPQKI